MVRTYAWNPSVNSTIHLEDAKTSCPSEAVSDSIADSGIDCPLHNAPPRSEPSETLSKTAPIRRRPFETGTTLFGVHTVSIDGQTYFQPFDCAMHQFINAKYSTAHDNRPYLPDSYLPLSSAENSDYFQRNVEAEHLAMLAAIQSAARSQPHSAEQTHKETFSESWQKAEQDEMANDPLNESFKSGHNSLPDFSLKDKMSLPSNEHIRRISHPNVGRCSRENKEDGSMNDELPWARGHPQPKTGVRGKANWYVNDGYLNTSFARERLEQSHNAFDVSLPPLSRFSGGTERSWPNVLGSHISNGISRVLPQNFNDNTLPKNLYNFNQKELSGSSPMDIPKPYGYGYAPHQSYDNLSNSVGLANASPSALGDRLPNISGPNLSLSQSFSSNPARMEKERHKMELLRQIEDNKRRKEMEKFKEWEEDERRRIQDEMYNERQRRMLEEEQRKEKEKAAAMERKAEQVAYEKANVARTARPRRRTPVPSVTPPQRRRELVPAQYQMQEAEPVHRAEFIRSDSPPIPTLRNKMAEMAVSKPEPFPQLQGVNENRSVSRNSIIRK